MTQLPERLMNAKSLEGDPDVLDELVDYIVDTNEEAYNITKAIEELSELSLALSQYLNKKGTSKEPTKREIASEMADVNIRLTLLSHPGCGIFSTRSEADEIHAECVSNKLEKYLTFVKEGKHIGRI